MTLAIGRVSSGVRGGTAPSSLVKCRCASAYASEAARFLLGDSFHPGGAALTARLGVSLDLTPASLLLDVACGPGSSVERLAGDSGCRAVGLDLSEDSLRAAADMVARDVARPRVRFVRGDAEALPFADGSADAVLCECALCAFPDQALAASEIARVLRRGGRVALSDMVAEPSRLLDRLRALDAHVACVAGARPLEGLAALLAAAGMTIARVERHDDALVALIDRVEARLRLARVTASAPALDVLTGLELVGEARTAVARGVLGYGVVVAQA